MIQTQLALLQRELWEHRAVFVVPVIVAVITLLMSWTGQMTIGELEHLDAGIVGLSNMPENVRAAALSFTMVGLAVSFIIAMWILTIFYALDALYAERKDRSILFWRSIPVTDFETVLSKLLTALLVIPLVTFVIIAATQLLVLLSLTVQVDARGGSPLQLIWAAAPYLGRNNRLVDCIAALAVAIHRLVPFRISVYEALTTACRCNADRIVADVREAVL